MIAHVKPKQRQQQKKHRSCSGQWWGKSKVWLCFAHRRQEANRETTGWSSKHPGSLLLQNDIMHFGCLLQKTAAAYPIKWVKTTWKLYTVNDGTSRFWTRQDIWPVGFVRKSKSRMKNISRPQSQSQSQNTDAEQVEVATTTGAAVIYLGVEGLLEVRTMFTMWKDSTRLNYKNIVLCFMSLFMI